MIITLQRRMRELGRIRTGDRSEKGAPRKLETFRITSPSRQLIEEAAGLWGGKVERWDSPNGSQWQTITETDTLPVVIPGGQSIGQYFELWSGGGCQRRCDGQTELISDQPCVCDPDPELRDCKPTTRLNVMLPDLSDLGQWRLESHGYYAAAELAGVADLLGLAKAQYVQARLRLEPRSVKRPGKGTRRFAVPVIELPDVKLGDVLASLGLTGGKAAIGTAEVAPALEPPDDDGPDTDEAWSELWALVAEVPDGTMEILETRLRRLYELMEQVGLWTAGSSGVDPLHAALARHKQAEHVGDLRRDDLVDFVGLSWPAAQKALGEAT